MICRNTFAFIMLLACVACFAPSTHAVLFSTQDLSGTWYGHQVVSGDAPGDDPRWGYGGVTIDSSGNYTASWTSPTQTNEVSAGTIQISTTGMITVDNQSLTHGVMNDDKDLIVFIDGTNQSQGNALTVMVKRSPAVQSGQNLLLLNRPTK
ncbi:MAG: hypothetical protein OEM01_02905 [Desulfobulbaceae bacterium]|nr:hypothetical protein [Desulfobulbaceae bacterium]